MTAPPSQTTITQIDFMADGFRLMGTLYRPCLRTNRTVIGCHGLLSDRTSPKQIDLARRCTATGIAYLAFDHRGCGQSDGDFEMVTTLAARSRDLLAAAEFIRTKTDLGPRLGLFGSSMGGTVCLAMAKKIKPWAIVTVAAPIKSASIIPTEKNAKDTGNFPPSFYRQKLQFDITDTVSDVDNLLLFHGDADETVPVSHGREIHSLASQPKKIIIQKSGDHRMSNPVHQRKFIRETVDWYHARM
jgi:fermentation-respiration switch protein FrsA (DUF1100 family)